MRSKDPFFHFKQFSVTDDNSALKIGTDAVLLGVWANIEDAKTILDVGCGSGIIALMLAQRNPKIKNIDAIDFHEGSIKDACENFRKSIWGDRLRAHHIAWEDFLKASQNQYDLIISNPPFFMDSLKSIKEKKNIAKHAETLNAEILISTVKDRLSSNGHLNMILPFEQIKEIKEFSFENKLSISRECQIFSKPNQKANRVLLELSKKEKPELKTSNLTIRNNDNSYTEEYKSLTKDFYLNL